MASMFSASKSVAALVVVLLLMIQRNNALPRGHSEANKMLLQNYTQSKNSENVTGSTVCPSNTVEQIAHCGTDLYRLAMTGFPWSSNSANLSEADAGPIKDTLSSLDHICQMFSRFQDCIRLHNIFDYCLMIPPYSNFEFLKVSFHFICDVTQRNVNTFQSLQCLKDTRVMSVLDFHMGKECLDGLEVLNNQVRMFHRTLFYMLDLHSAFYRRGSAPNMGSKLCLPSAVIHGCVKKIVKNICGDSASEMVVKFIGFQQKQFANAVTQVGLSPVDCDSGQNRQFRPKTSTLRATHKSGNLAARLYGLEDPRLHFMKIISQESPGTALDTNFGRELLTYLRNATSAKRECSLNVLSRQYLACWLFSTDPTEPPKYSILPSGHRTSLIQRFGTQCNRRQDFEACWNLQKGVCGQVTKYFEHDFILQIDSCYIQQYMERIQCNWQDMMFEFYIQASQHSDWPLGRQSGEPLYLDNVTYKFREIAQSMHHFLHLLELGIERIASRCGHEASERLYEVYGKLNHTLNDALLLTAYMNPHSSDN